MGKHKVVTAVSTGVGDIVAHIATFFSHARKNVKIISRCYLLIFLMAIFCPTPFPT
jgi:hypothetical protein